MEEWKEERGRAKKEGKRQRSCDLQILVQTAYIVDVRATHDAQKAELGKGDTRGTSLLGSFRSDLCRWERQRGGSQLQYTTEVSRTVRTQVRLDARP